MIHVEAADIVRLQRSLRNVDKEANRALNRRVRRIAEPIADEVRRAALQLSADAVVGKVKRTKKSGALGLRRGIAGAVDVRVGSSARTALARIRVSGSKFKRLTDKPPTLPRYMEGLSRKRWRHPVFLSKDANAKPGRKYPGNSKQWVDQDAHPYLLPTVLPHKAQVREQIVETYLDALEVQIREHGLTVRHY